MYVNTPCSLQNRRQQLREFQAIPTFLAIYASLPWLTVAVGFGWLASRLVRLSRKGRPCVAGKSE